MADTTTQVDAVEDDALRLMLLTCHPALTVESQVALTLRLVGGLTSREIARALLVPEATVVRRITRAKTTLAQLARSAGRDDSPLDLPDPVERRRRLPAVMNVAYLIFTEGYAATSGDDWLRPELCHDALRLARLLTALAPDEPETHGLLALLELQSSRGAARTDDTGGLVLLEQQDRSRWDQLAIRRGCEALGRALAAGPPGPYALQAAVAACHARAGSVAGTDWTSIAGLYDALARLTDSPVVLVNRAVAHGMSAGPAVGLRLVDELADAPGLRGSHLLPSVRGDLLERLGHTEAARLEFQRAAALTGNSRERAFLLDRAGKGHSGPAPAGPP
jgi:predicted RNA polymerase sigma factor